MSTSPGGASTYAVPVSQGFASATHRLLDGVMATLRGADLAGAAAAAGATPEALSAARDAFLSAGTGAVAEIGRATDFRQVNLSLEGGSEVWAALVGSSLQDELGAWLDADPSRRFFFMHKPPGIRLRIRGLDADAHRTLLSRLDAAIGARGAIAQSGGPYDPEVAQFGGPAGVELAHHFFTVESRAVLGYHRLRLNRQALLTPSEFSLLLLDAVLSKLVGDRWELWDVWTKMVLTGRIDPGAIGDPVPERHERLIRSTRALLLSPQRRLARAGNPEQELFGRYELGLRGVLESARAAITEGSLLWGLREILPFWIIFHWNRMGFSPARQRTLTRLMCWSLCPKQEPS